jgi:hypothetical protein
MPEATLRTRALHRAAGRLGGVPQLAAVLSVPETALLEWMAGKDVPPDAVFDAAMEIFLAAPGTRPALQRLRPPGKG